MERNYGVIIFISKYLYFREKLLSRLFKKLFKTQKTPIIYNLYIKMNYLSPDMIKITGFWRKNADASSTEGVGYVIYMFF